MRPGESWLRAGEAQGYAHGSKHQLQWQLRYEGGQDPLLLLPAPMYEHPFPKAKALVSRPLVRFKGNLIVDGEPIVVTDWPGSENHNRGERHTDAYALGQVCGIDNDPNAILECASARLRLGPIWSLLLTTAVLRYSGQDFNFNRMQSAWRQKVEYAPRSWNFTCADSGVCMHVRIGVRAQDTVALRYRNPPGGIKTCLNSRTRLL